MFVLIHKNRVISGPRDWNNKMFEHALREEANIVQSVSIAEPEQFPYVIDSDTVIKKVELIYPEYNKKIQYAEGPFWDLSGDIVIGTFEVKDNPIEPVKNVLKNRIAGVRYFQEIEGTKETIQGKEVTISTTRESRANYSAQIALMGDSINWKFPEGWMVLTKSELQSVADAAYVFVQNKYNEEYAKVQQIDAATSLQELDAIVIGDEELLLQQMLMQGFQ